MRKLTFTKVALAISSIMLVSAPAMSQADEIRVAWYGGNWGEAFNTCIAEPFTARTGITVIPEIGTSTTSLAKLKQQADKPIIDVVFLDGGISEIAQADGLLAAINPDEVKNLANAHDAAIYKDKDDIFAVSAGYYSLGLTYNKDEIQEEPTTWEELWNPDYAGAIVIPSPANSAGVPFVAFLAGINNASLDNLEPVYKKIKELDVASYFDSSGAASNAFQSGEAIIGAHFNVGAWDLADKGLPIGFAVPKEGVWATDARLHQVKNSPSPKAAAEFINEALTTEASACLASKLYLGPAVKDAVVASEVAEKMPWGKDGSIENLNLLDWSEINAHRAAITDAWNREVVGN